MKTNTRHLSCISPGMGPNIHQGAETFQGIDGGVQRDTINLLLIKAQFIRFWDPKLTRGVFVPPIITRCLLSHYIYWEEIFQIILLSLDMSGQPSVWRSYDDTPTLRLPQSGKPESCIKWRSNVFQCIKASQGYVCKTFLSIWFSVSPLPTLNSWDVDLTDVYVQK